MKRPSQPPYRPCCACFVAGEPGGGREHLVSWRRGWMRRQGVAELQSRAGAGRGVCATASGCERGWRVCRPTRFTTRNTHWRTPGALVRNPGNHVPVDETLDICDQIEPLPSRKFGIVYYFPNHPHPILSPGGIVIGVVRPSGCRMNRWLPFCLICRKPMFSNALITFLAGRGLIASITQKLRLAGCQ